MSPRRDDDRAGVAMPRLDERALEFLRTLDDIGLLDAAVEAQILDRVTERADGPVDLDALRRVAAEVLFERQYDIGADTIGFLDEEWRAIFH